jgi:hypothetical protein
VSDLSHGKIASSSDVRNDFTGTINKIIIRLNDQAHEGIAAHTQAFRN